jgi:hypothetical protein
MTEARPFADQRFADLRSKCLESGKLFEDPKFPANEQSLYV